ncbi:MotA/TolQ/ExbB proton channel family protein [Pararhodobacter zhoushanensis]|uniref:MotA/TolQ/ExbB proton channel family protein n=1 Tax=Pararhodobacter zhoushanensis TaxID=2479545 RepID=UPI000F8E3F07|nr:MotA/TolQ/ExbB proton channel family protein [Pararhodobacter zhoushanensis]
MTRFETLQDLLHRGGPVMALLALLSVLTLTVILWKVLSLWRHGAFSHRAARVAADSYARGQRPELGGTGAALDVVRASIELAARLPDAVAREDCERIAKETLARLGSGLRLLDLIGTLAPLLGLLGTVLGMIDAFQTLADAGSRADPALLAGGIWQALLTTAAGMIVAIPALAAHAWFEGILDRLAETMESTTSRVFTTKHAAP